MPSKVISARSHVGVAVRRADPVAIAAARQELAAAKLEAYVAKVVAEAPPLSPEQSRSIAALLYPGSAEPPTEPRSKSPTKRRPAQAAAEKPADGGDAV